jgi:hypothetical protein
VPGERDRELSGAIALVELEVHLERPVAREDRDGPRTLPPARVVAEVAIVSSCVAAGPTVNPT